MSNKPTSSGWLLTFWGTRCLKESYVLVNFQTGAADDSHTRQRGQCQVRTAATNLTSVARTPSKKCSSAVISGAPLLLGIEQYINLTKLRFVLRPQHKQEPTFFGPITWTAKAQHVLRGCRALLAGFVKLTLRCALQ